MKHCKQIANNVYIEDWGMALEDFHVGRVIKHRPGRTITETDNTWFSLLVNNDHPVHIDEPYASQTEFHRRLVGSLVTVSIVNGMTVKTMSYQAICNLGWKNIRLPHPVFIGDTLYAESEILVARASNSRENAGIVTILTRGFNQDGVLILECERTFMVPSRVGEAAQ